jgi:DNA repair protein RecO (recombination protein O)
MINRIDLQPAYVLHTIPFQNTSLLVDFFCLDYGRVRAVAKGARGPKSRIRSQLQPFQPLLITLSGRGEVKTLINVELSVMPLKLTGMRLFSGLYMNELLVRLLQFHESHTSLYQNYQRSLVLLHASEDIGAVLRKFELNLLRELGYQLDLEFEMDSEIPVTADKLYQFLPESGFRALQKDSRNPAGSTSIFNGRDLIALRDSDFSSRNTAAAAKRLTRMALKVHLGEKPLLSHQLFRTMTLSADSDTG